jgi:MPBQ/MSBQ methyltransferase
MDVSSIVRGHYGEPDIEQPILSALAGAGRDVTALRVEDLAPVDELHAGGLAATRHLLDRLDLDAQCRLLDVGCGIGGPARAAAGLGSCRVTGVDLTPEFVAAATALTARVGLAERATFQVVPDGALPFDDGSFDRAMMVHVGMNVPDKAALFAQIRRVLAPGGLFAVFDQMRVGDGAVPYPMPWADDERSSFLETIVAYRSHLEAAGLVVEGCEDRTASDGGPPPPGSDPRLGPQVVFGPGFRERIENNLAATAAGLLAPVLIVARAT